VSPQSLSSITFVLLSQHSNSFSASIKVAMSSADDYDFQGLVHWTSSMNYPFNLDQDLPLHIPTNFPDPDIHQKVLFTSTDNANLRSARFSTSTLSTTSANDYEDGNNLKNFDEVVLATLTDKLPRDASGLAIFGGVPGPLEDL